MLTPTYTIVQIQECQYNIAEIAYMLPGIIHKEFGDDDYEFKELISECIIDNSEIANSYQLKLNYYENMSTTVGRLLAYYGITIYIRKMLVNYYVTEAEVSDSNTIYLHWLPRV